MTGRGPSQRNIFFKNTLQCMGGSEGRAIKLYERHGRFGGGRTDTVVYMKNFDTNFACYWTPRATPDSMCQEIFGCRNQITPESIKWCVDDPDVPTDTSPGITYRRLGFHKKADALPLCQVYLKELFKMLEQGIPTKFNLIWCIAGRPKFTEVEAAYRKVMNRNSVGRSVWVSDLEEAVMSRHYTRKIDKKFMGVPGRHKIMINLDKGSDAQRLQEWVEGFDHFIEADYSKFDASVPRRVIEYAFDVLLCLYKPMDHLTTTVYNLLKEAFLDSYVDLGDGKLVLKSHGIPSGSGFTSIIGSICNYVMLDEVLTDCGLASAEWDAIVYGDDCLIGLKSRQKDAISGFTLKKKIIKTMADKFGMKLDPADTKFVSEKYVKICIPEYEGDTSLGTSQLKPVSLSYQDCEPDCGTLSRSSSHRWWYTFTDTWKFLGFSMTKAGKLIRPTSEVLARIYNPEQPIKSWDDHITSLKMAYLENYDNAHTRNRIYHYLLDAWWVLNHGFQNKEIPDVESTILGGRCWYRYSSQWVDLNSYPPIEKFNDFFLKFDRDVMDNHHRIPIDERYHAYIKRGRLTATIVDTCLRPAYYRIVRDTLLVLGMRGVDSCSAYAFGKDLLSDSPTFTSDCMYFLSNRDLFYGLSHLSVFRKKISIIKKNLQKKIAKIYKKPEKKITNLDLLCSALTSTLPLTPSFRFSGLRW